MKKYFLIELIKRVTKILNRDWRTMKALSSKVKSFMWSHFNEKKMKAYVLKIMFLLLFDEMIYASKLFLFSTSMHFCNVCFHLIQRCKTVCFNSTKFHFFVKNSLAFSCEFFSASRNFNHSCFNRVFSLTHALLITFKSDEFADQSIFLMFFFCVSFRIVLKLWCVSTHCFQLIIFACRNAFFVFFRKKNIIAIKVCCFYKNMHQFRFSFFVVWYHHI